MVRYLNEKFKYVLTALFMFTGFVAVDLFLRYYTNDIGFFDFHQIAPLLFTCLWSIVLTSIFLCLPRWLGRTLYTFSSLVLLLYGCGQYIYYQLFKSFIWFNDIAIAGEGSDYLDYVFSLIDDKILTMFCFSAICIFFAFVFFPKRPTYLSTGINLIAIGAMMLVYPYLPDLIAKPQDQEWWDSWKYPRYVYDNFTNQPWMMQVSGFYEYIQRDFYTTFLKSNEVDQSEYDRIDEYFMTRGELEANEMTGLYKDKNVIVVMMESMDDWMIDPTYTPALYWMSQNGMNFTDHYAPIFGSGATFNSEFAFNTGNYSPNAGNAAYSFSKNNFSYSIANLFKNAGYEVNSFHYNEPEFYNRATMHINMGYESHTSFVEVTNDYDQSVLDTVMVDNDEIYEKISQHDGKFFDFIITYSAHLPYSTYANMCSYQYRNHPELFNSAMDTETNCAYAQAKITDDFFKGLLERLHEDGLLEDTVIVAYTDHYTYGFSDEDKLLHYSLDRGSSIFDKVPMLIYHYGDEPMEVDKTNATIDLLPTIANLFDLKASKYYMGQDIFDPRYGGLAYFKDYSWYDGHTYMVNGEVVFSDGSQTAEKMEAISEEVSNRIRYGEKMVTLDYYNYLKKRLGS